jgi:hypothetical protein
VNTPYDCVFLSYDEPLADRLYRHLVGRFGTVKRLHGVRGMRRAYRLTAEMVDTEFYFIADGDFEVRPQFDPAVVEGLGEGVAMRVWQTMNPVNGLIYGHGGLKLCRSSAVRCLDPAVDVLAGVPGRVEFHRVVAGYTRFNQSPLHAWRAGFRECAMLSRGCEYGTLPGTAAERVATWLRGGQGDFAEWTTRGAHDGLAFSRELDGKDLARWDRLNDPAWLECRFTETYRQPAVAGRKA